MFSKILRVTNKLNMFKRKKLNFNLSIKINMIVAGLVKANLLNVCTIITMRKKKKKKKYFLSKERTGLLLLIGQAADQRIYAINM